MVGSRYSDFLGNARASRADAGALPGKGIATAEGAGITAPGYNDGPVTCSLGGGGVFFPKSLRNHAPMATTATMMSFFAAKIATQSPLKNHSFAATPPATSAARP